GPVRRGGGGGGPGAGAARRGPPGPGRHRGSRRAGRVRPGEPDGAGVTGELVHEVFRARTREAPDAPALVAGERVITYRELDERSDVSAARLRADGIGAESVVALCLPPAPDIIVAML